jgi:ppGpp synthetase/RelA/SpoT-type nucleotidyltranferase
MVSFLWTEINHTVRYKTLGLINNGIELHLKNNTIEKFVVEDAETVLVAINKQLVV